jgi:exopolyphosphatase/guanosine-5'-triphosphate,3'-diphosphate pyrophosphatase
MTIQGEAKIVLRWEWRTFDASLNTIEGRIAAALEQVAPHTSAEIYLLRLGGPQNAKIRDGILDVKRLQQVDVNGLELWEPVLKAKFPLSQNDVATAFLEWQLSLPGLGRKTYTIDQFTNQLIVLSRIFVLHP